MPTEPSSLQPGDYAPWFHAPALSGAENFSFNTVGGRLILMLFFGSAKAAPSAEALEVVARHRQLFDDEHAAFFGITVDPRDEAEGKIAQQIPGIRFFLDYKKEVSRLYGVLREETHYDPHWLVLDRELRILRRFPIGAGEAAIAFIAEEIGRMQDRSAPVITIPGVLEPELCRTLIELYEREGGQASGFMRDVGGKTTLIVDSAFKRRKDCTIADERLCRLLAARIERRIAPAIKRAFQFTPTRIERYLVACYEPDHGHFRPHRDNTTFGTAHRRFAVTINLNADEYEGGDLRFPEFGAGTYRAPTGGAIVFSCSLLHEATPVTAGKRYAFLPFLYDEAGAEVRQKNLSRLAGNEPLVQNAGS